MRAIDILELRMLPDFFFFKMSLCRDPPIVLLTRDGDANIYASLTKHKVKMAGYWPRSFFAFLWTETKSRSIKTQKNNEANIQPS